MKIARWKNWSIRTRLLAITIFPVVYLFCSVALYSYHSRLQEAREELAERANIVTAALAESLEHNIVSDNVSGLKLTLNSLVQSDQSIYRIELFDVNQVEICRATSYVAIDPETRTFEKPIKKQLFWVNLLSETDLTRPAAATTARPPGKVRDTVGYVRVTMSPTNMLAKQTRRFAVELGMAALALAVSGVLAFSLSKSLTRPLKAAVEALREIRAGDYAVQVAVSTGGEIGGLQASINDMAVSLRQSKEDLENKVLDRTRDLVASRNDALRSDAEKRKLIQKVHSVVEDERKSIAIEIHDELNASLIAARLESQRILHLAAQAEAQAPGREILEIQERARAIIKLTLDLYASGRNLVRRLRPEVLDMLGLHGAVEEMLRHYNGNGQLAGCRIECSASGDFSALGSDVAISAYRIVQEAVSNVLKHAAAPQASVSLTVDGEENMLLIEITDTGSGFDPARTVAGIGLIGMRERVYAFNGDIRIKTAPHAGTCIRIHLPLTPPAPQSDDTSNRSQFPNALRNTNS